MMSHDAFLGFIETAGRVVIHSTWVIVALALAAKIVFSLTRAPRIRYAAAISALILSVPLALTSVAKLPLAMPTTPAIHPATSIIEMQVDSTPLQPVVASERHTRFSIRGIIGTTWVIGVLGFSVYHLGGYGRLRRLSRQANLIVDEDLLTRFSELGDRLGLTRTVRLAESHLVTVPAVIGHVRPLVLLPLWAITGLSPAQLDAVLAHELAHVRRRDYLINMLQIAVETLAFYHPCVWWLSSVARRERENCCDDIASDVVGRGVYVDALVQLETLAPPAHGSVLSPAATGGHRGSLLARVRRLVRGDRPTGNIFGAAFFLLTVTAAAVGFTFSGYTGAPSPTSRATWLEDVESLNSVRPEDLVYTPYKILPGDLIWVDLKPGSGELGTSLQTRVTDAGTVEIPDLGSVKVTGLTNTEAALAITRANLNRPVQVLVSDARGIRYSVFGDVMNPGEFSASSISDGFRVSDALLQAGAIPDGSGRRQEVTVIRASDAPASAFGLDRRIRLPLDRVLLKDAELDMVVRPGDIISVSLPLREEQSETLTTTSTTKPIVPDVYFVSGAVSHAGRYAIGNRYRPVTLFQALVGAGTKLNLADVTNIEITRRSQEADLVRRFKLSEIQGRSAGRIRIFPGDRIKVWIDVAPATQPAP